MLILELMTCWVPRTSVSYCLWSRIVRSIYIARLTQPLNLVLGTQIHSNRIPIPSNLIIQPLNTRERSLQPIPLSAVLFAASCVGQRVGEDGVVGPEGEFLQRWTACKELLYPVSS